MNYMGPRRRRRRKKRDWESIWKDYSWKLPNHGKENSQSTPGSQSTKGSSESAIQDKSKEKHVKTYINRTIKK